MSNILENHGAAVLLCDELFQALTESVKLQSHYASLLNMHDGGHRLTFDDADDWMKRLRAVQPRADAEPLTDDPSAAGKSRGRTAGLIPATGANHCKAQPTADPPQDCDWPFCGCDPTADKVLAAIQESDCAIVPLSALREVFELAQAHVMQMPPRNPQRRMAISAAFADCRKAVEPLTDPIANLPVEGASTAAHKLFRSTCGNE